MPLVAREVAPSIRVTVPVRAPPAPRRAEPGHVTDRANAPGVRLEARVVGFAAWLLAWERRGGGRWAWAGRCGRWAWPERGGAAGGGCGLGCRSCAWVWDGRMWRCRLPRRPEGTGVWRARLRPDCGWPAQSGLGREMR